MKLRDLFARMRPMFVGTATPEATAEAIYGEDAESIYGRRLVLYHSLESGRARELRLAFPACAQQLGDAWTALAAEYYRSTPWGAYDWAPAGDGFSAYLRQHAASLDRAWLAEVATLEWALYNQPPIGAPTRDGPLRLGERVRILDFAYAVPRWFVGRDRSAPPALRSARAALWTSPTGVALVTPLDDLQSALVVQLAAGALVLEAIPSSAAAVADTIERFLRAGIVAGAPDAALELPAADVRSPPVRTVGRDLSVRYRLVPTAYVREVDDAVHIGMDDEDLLAGSDARLAVVARAFTAETTLRDVVERVGTEVDAMTTVEIADALVDAGLLVSA